MSQVEELLRTALRNAPTPETSTGDPLADLERRLGRARKRLAWMAAAAVIVVVAGIVVPLSLIGPGSSPSGSDTASSQSWPDSRVTSLTSGGGYVWTVTDKPSPSHDRYYVQKRNPETGQVLASYLAGPSEEFVAYGAGEVWTWGGGDGGDPDGVVVVLTDTGASETNANLGRGKGILTVANRIGMAFVGNVGYAVQENDHTIMAFDSEEAESAAVERLAVPGALSVLAVHGTLLAVGANRVVGQFPTNTGWPPPVRTAQDLKHRAASATEPIKIKGLPLVASAAGVWALEGGQLVQQDLAGHQLGGQVDVTQQGDPASATGPDPAQVAVDRAGGLYVAVNRTVTNRNAGTLLYYSPTALTSSDPRPTATHVSTGRISSITADPSGGVVFAGSILGRWNPVAQ